MKHEKVFMKKINEYKIPNHYIEIAEKFYNFLMENYKDRILLFILGGSTVFENIIEGLSDIDFMIILDECSPDDYKKIYEFKNKFDIKLCGNIFTLEECQKKQIDYIAMYYLYLIKINFIEPIYISKKFINNISKEDMQGFMKHTVILNLRTLKEMAYSRKLNDTRVLIKYILHLEKDYLILKGIYCKSKDEVLNKFNNMFNIKFNLSVIDCYKNKLSEEDFSILLEYIDTVIVIFNLLEF